MATKDTDNMANDLTIERSYAAARETYAAQGVDTEAALTNLSSIALSLHCWQGDDVQGFEVSFDQLGGGLAVTGDYPGKSRTPDELRADLEKVLSLIPDRHRLNLHASYGEFNGQKVDRNEIESQHFQGWVDWAKSHRVGLDFNPTYFAHRKAADGFTLAHSCHDTREFWIEHGKRCRRIAAEMGKQLGTRCITNFWIPDGFKDMPVDRWGPRQRLMESLDHVFSESFDPQHALDAVESKLFGIGSESYVVGSHEFYLGYAISRQKMLCLDSGHFHPTESIADKLSSVLSYLDRVLLHISRGVRWDSDHVVTLSDEVRAIAQEVVRGHFLNRVQIGLDFFDASINRLAAWVIGMRNVQKALLMALLEPIEQLREAELCGDFTRRLALLEEQKTLPFSDIWNYHCLRQNVPVGIAWLNEVRDYEHNVLAQR